MFKNQIIIISIKLEVPEFAKKKQIRFKLEIKIDIHIRKHIHTLFFVMTFFHEKWEPNFLMCQISIQCGYYSEAVRLLTEYQIVSDRLGTVCSS